MRRGVSWLSVWAGLALMPCAHAGQTAAVDPAHALAAKFSSDGASTPMNPKPDSARQVAGATSPAGAKDQRPSLDYEMEMLKRARAENAERRPAAPPASAAPKTATSAGVTPPPPTSAPPTSAQGPALTSPAPSLLIVSPPTTQPAASAPAQAVAPPPAAAPDAPAAVEVKAEPKSVSPPANVEAKAEPIPAAAPQALAAPLAATPPLKAPLAATPPLTAPLAATPPLKAPIAATPPPAAPATIAGPPAPRATILVVLETKSSGTAGGLQRIANPPDPIICLGDDCYLSSGFETAARRLPRNEALALKNSSEASASSCKDKTACVFRDVPVARETELRLVDLSSASHDNHTPVDVRADVSCAVTDDELTCDEPVTSPDHRIWIVPEVTATKAGAAGLEDALAQGLPEEDVTRVSDK